VGFCLFLEGFGGILGVFRVFSGNWEVFGVGIIRKFVGFVGCGRLVVLWGWWEIAGNCGFFGFFGGF